MKKHKGGGPVAVSVERSASPAKFTPGPWRVEEGGSIKATWKDTGDDIQVASMNRTHWDTANSNGRNEKLARESVANARLIAAAPDMYEALLAIREWLLFTETTDKANRAYLESFVRANNLANIAITKAEGATFAAPSNTSTSTVGRPNE